MKSCIGIDEAGRGPVFGPLVIGIVHWTPDDDIESVKIDDSKSLSDKERKKSFKFIIENFDYTLLSIPASVISRPDETIPQLESRIIAETLKKFPEKPVKSDVISNGCKAHNWIKNTYPERDIMFEEKADNKYSAVGAASIVAKVERDRAIDRLSEKWGNIGSGYPSDPVTRKWLENHFKSNSETVPNFVRSSWSTVDKIRKNCS